LARENKRRVSAAHTPLGFAVQCGAPTPAGTPWAFENAAAGAMLGCGENGGETISGNQGRANASVDNSNHAEIYSNKTMRLDPIVAA
jgi:hypothetical protein